MFSSERTEEPGLSESLLAAHVSDRLVKVAESPISSRFLDVASILIAEIAEIDYRVMRRRAMAAGVIGIDLTEAIVREGIDRILVRK